MGKELRYGWDKILGVPGGFEMISKKVLNIDHTYQRPVVANAKILGYASKWDWALCGALLVADREGIYYVMDGQQRLAAACKRSDIDELPCVVYLSKGREWEAGVFWKFNTIKSMTSPFSRFTAKLCERDADTVKLVDFVKSLGYSITNSDGSHDLQFIGTLSNFYSQWPENTEKALRLCTEIHSDGRITKDIFLGVYSIVVNGIILDSLAIKKLRSAGYNQICTAIADQKRAMGGGSMRPAAMGLLKIANYGRRTHRYELPPLVPFKNCKIEELPA